MLAVRPLGLPALQLPNQAMTARASGSLWILQRRFNRRPPRMASFYGFHGAHRASWRAAAQFLWILPRTATVSKNPPEPSSTRARSSDPLGFYVC